MIVLIVFFLLLLIGVPMAYVVLGAAITGILFYTNTSMLIVIQQMFGGLDNFVMLAIPLFIIGGNIAAKGKTSVHLISVMNVIFGRIKGGSVIATIAACTFFSAISGSGLATIVAIGTIMIPSLVKDGYPQKMAMGSVCTTGSLGILLPPSTPMILFCVAMGTSVGKQFMAGFVPGIILAVCWMVYLYIVCRNKDYGNRVTYTIKEAAIIIFRAIPALIFPLIVLGSIYTGWATPTEAAALSVVYVLLLEVFVYKTIKPQKMFSAFFEGIINSSTLVLIIAAASVMNWLLTVQQVPMMITEFLTVTVSSKIAFILLLWLIFLVVGLFVDLIALIVVLAPILLPSLSLYNIDPIHFGIIAIMASQIGCITPPFGVNLFVTMNVSGRPFAEVMRSTFPYLIILFLVSMIVTFVPQIALWLPNLMR